MDRTERFYLIDRLLHERRIVSRVQFLKALGVSLATFKRDLEYMRDRLHAPIEYDRESNGYRFGMSRSGPRYELPGLWFSAQEVYALLTTLELLNNLQPGLLDGQVSPLVERLRAILGSGDHSWQEIQQRIRIFQPERRQSMAEHFGVVAAAVLKRQRLWVRHYNRMEHCETEREISPQRLVHYRDNWYVDGYCHLRDAIRSFAVDAIRHAALRDTKAKEISEAELDKYLTSGYGIFAGSEVEWATLRFSVEAARWVSAQNWHPEQRTRVEKDGSYLLEVPYAHDRELVMEILKYGADVEVVGPAALRERVATVLTQAARRYGSTTASIQCMFGDSIRA